ncbi:MAG TPA: hypothetical protein VK696_02395 [Steroidobacteraceae bacterium]|nr:hypothetical protein [Steroidobacteraceae bacterium]
MTAVLAQQRAYGTLIWVSAALLAAMLVSAAAHAGPEVTFYLTVPLGTASGGHVLGLRLDKNSVAPDIRIFTPDSPLNRRALLDLQLGADSALRLDLNRRLTWDVNRQQWRPSSMPATFDLRLPMHDLKSNAVEHAPQPAAFAHPLEDELRKPLVKPLTIEP